MQSESNNSNLPSSELVSSTDFKIALTPGSSYADAYRLSPDPLWQNAWNTRIHPFIDTYPQPGHELVDKIIADSDYALYDNFFAIRYTGRMKAHCEICTLHHTRGKECQFHKEIIEKSETVNSTLHCGV